MGIIGPAQMDALQLSVYSKGSTKPYPGFTISMANTTSTSLLFGFESTGFTQVYSSDYSTSSGINRFNFATPFSWDGVSNIAVNFCYDNKIAEPGVAESVIIDLTGSNYYSAFYNGAASANAGCSLSAGNISTHRMYSTLHVFSSGTAISTALNSSSNKYLGPNAEVYFYDASGNIMAKVKNNTAFDYGCTTLTIDRAGTGTSTFWNSTDAKINDLFQKSFKLTPTNTYFASNHSITLYYTNTEVTNWQNITGLPLSSAQMVRIYGSSIPAVTPSNPLYSIVTTNTQTPAVFGTQGYTITIDDVIGTISGIGLGVGLPGNAVAIADFRTKGSGNFGAASIWEYQNTSTSYANALQIPGSSNNITIRQGHTVTMDNNFNLGGSKSLRDSGTLDCKTFIVGGSSGNFFLPAAGTLQIGSADGITTYNNAIGNIQTYGRSFSQDANYVYNGLTSQITGSGLPDSVKNLTLQNNTTLSFSKATTIKNNLILISGNLVLNTNALTLRGPITYGFGILQGSGTSVLNIEGPVGTLKFDQTYPSFYSLFSLNVNAGGSANLGSNLSARSVYINPGSVFTVKTPYTLQAITQ